MNDITWIFKKPLTPLNCIDRGRTSRTGDAFVLLYSLLVRQLVHFISVGVSFTYLHIQ